MICTFLEEYVRVGWGCAGVRHYFWVASDGRKDWSIDRSVGNPTPTKDNFVTVSVSEFYLVSVPDILYGGLRDFYMILNCVGTHKLNYADMQNARVTIEQWLLAWSYIPGYLWKSERISNLSIFNNMKKSFKKKSLTYWVDERGYDGCNRFLTGRHSICFHRKIYNFLKMLLIQSSLLKIFSNVFASSNLNTSWIFTRKNDKKIARNNKSPSSDTSLSVKYS